MEGLDLANITVDVWAAWIDQMFAVAVDGDSEAITSITLIEAKQKDGPGFGGRMPYSLLFRGSTGSCLAQSTWWLSHPELGTMPVFLVPVGASSDGFDYEAIFG